MAGQLRRIVAVRRAPPRAGAGRDGRGLRWPAAVLALRLQPSSRHRHAGRRGRAGRTRRRERCTSASATTRSSCSSRERAHRARRSPPTSRGCIGLEGCIAGNVPAGVDAARRRERAVRAARTRPSRRRSCSAPARSSTSRCASSRRSSPTRTAARRAARRARRGGRPQARAGRRGARSARPTSSAKAARARQRRVHRELLRLALRYGLRSEPRIDDPNFVSSSSSTPSKPRGDAQGALRLPVPEQGLRADPGAPAPDLTDAQRTRAIEQIRARGARCPTGSSRRAATYTVTGAPVVVDDLADTIWRSIALLLVAALLVDGRDARARLPRAGCGCCRSAIALAAAGADLRRRWRSPGASLTMASIAVLPVLHRPGGRLRDPAPVARAGGAAAAGRRRPWPPPRPWPRRRAHGRDRGRRDRRRLPRPAAVAGADGARLRPAARRGHRPRVRARAHRGHRGDGARRARRGAAARCPARSRRWPRRGAAPATSGRRAARGRRGRPGGARGARRVAPAAAGRARRPRARARRPAACSAIGAALALAGWVLDTQTRVESDIQQLVPQDLAALQRPRSSCSARPAWAARSTSLVEADDLADPEVIAWMADYQQRVARALRLQRRARLRQGRALPGVLAARPVPPAADERPRRSARCSTPCPPYFSQSVVTADRRDRDAGVRHPADAARASRRRSST